MLSGTGDGKRSTGASALSVIRHQGMPYVSVSDLAGSLSQMAGSLAKDSQQRVPLLMLLDVFEGMLAPPSLKARTRIKAQPCLFCQSPVVTLPAMGRDKPVTVEVVSAPAGEWVPVEKTDGTTFLVPYEHRLDGVSARVDTHVCRSSKPPVSSC